MNPLVHVKKLLSNQQAVINQEKAPEVPEGFIFSSRLFFAIEMESKSRIANINNLLMPLLNDINVKDEDLAQFIGKSYKQLEDDLSDYLAMSGMPKGMAKQFVIDRLVEHHKRRDSMFDASVAVYVEAPAAIPEPLQPFVTIEHDKDGKRYLGLNIEGMKVYAMVKPTEQQQKLINLLEELADVLNAVKAETGNTNNTFMQYLLNDYDKNLVRVDKEWLVTGLQGISPYMSVNLNALEDLTTLER